LLVVELFCVLKFLYGVVMVWIMYGVLLLLIYWLHAREQVGSA